MSFYDITKDVPLDRIAQGFFVETPETVPPLLTDLFQTDEVELGRIILVAKDKLDPVSSSAANERVVHAIRPGPKKSKGYSDDLNLTGSPLKCSFTLDPDEDDLSYLKTENLHTVKSPSYLPISAVDARKCVSRYNTSTVGRNCSPIWVMCDAKDGLLFIGAHRNGKSLQVNKVTCEGPYDSKSIPSFENFFKTHHFSSVASKKRPEVIARATYNLSEQLGDVTDDPLLQNEAVSSLKVLLSWLKPQSFLERPPVQSAAEVHVQIVLGDEQMQTYRLYNELELLKGFAQGLQGQSISWMKSEKREKTLQEEIDAVFDNHIGMISRGREKADTSKEVIGDEVLSLEERTSLDFSDVLWKCLSKVESFSQLANMLAYILKTIQTSEMRPFINPQNGTKIVAIINDIARGSKERWQLVGKEPLEILVEIGIEKLQRDYIHALTTNNLAIFDDLSPFITNDHLADVKLSISNLCKLHIIQELVGLSQKYLSSSVVCLTSLVQQALKALKNIDISIDDHSANGPFKFTFPISRDHVKDQLTKANPSVWQTRVKSSAPGFSLSTTAHFTMDPPSEFLPLKHGQSFDEKKLDISYYLTIATTITREM